MSDQDRERMRQRGIENSVRGSGKDLKGRIKDAAGGLTGDSELQLEGKFDRAKGKVQDMIGDAQRRLSEEDRSSDSDMDRR